MMKTSWLPVILLLVPALGYTAPSMNNAKEWSLVARLSVGNGTCDVNITSSGPDIPVVGPQALAIAPDSGIAIADTAGSRIIRLNRDGSCLAPILSGGLPVDVAIDQTGTVAILDCRAHTVTQTGKMPRTWTLKPGTDCDSLALDVHANPVVVINQTGHSLTSDATFKMGIPDQNASLHHFVRMTKDGRAVLISSPWGQDASAKNEVSRAWIHAAAGEELLAASFIGTDRASRRYVVLDTRNTADPTNQDIQRSIQVFEASGRLVAKTTIPPTTGMVRPRQALAVDPAGGVVALNNGKDGVTLWRWSNSRVGGTK